MRVRRNILIGFLTIIAASGEASADGFLSAFTASSSSTATVDWSGTYVGAQGGLGISQTGWTFPVDSYFTIPAGRRSYDTDPKGGFLGAHVTVNRQSGRLVYGVEAALNGSLFEDTRIGPFDALFPNDRFQTDIKQYGTLTGRLGYASDLWLLYANAGYAGGRVGLMAVSGPPGGGVIGEIKQYLNGWTVGAGLEYMLFQSVSVGLQYDFIRLYGEQDETQTYGTPSTDPFIIKSHDIDLHALSVRFSIKLDEPDRPVPPK